MKHLLLPVLLGLALTVSAAEKREGGAPPETGSTDARKEAAEAVAATAKARQEQDAFVAKAHKEMAELNTKMVELRKKAKKLGGEAKTKIDRQIRNLELDLKAAKQKLADLESAPVEKWQELKTEVSGVIDRLKLVMQEIEGDR